MLETAECMRTESIEDRVKIDPNRFDQIGYLPQDRAATLEEIALAITIDPDLTDVDDHLRDLMANAENDQPQAIANSHQVSNSSPQDLAAHQLQAISTIKTRKYRLALDRCDRYIELHPQDPHSYCDRGIYYDRLKEYTRALADFDKALELKPKEAVFHHARGRTHQQLGNFSAALSDYDLVIQAQPDRASVYNDRAEIYRLQGDYQRAIADYTQAINLNPLLVDAYFRRGIAYAELGDSDLAFVDYDLIIAIDPTHTEAYVRRSWIYFRRGKYTQAIQDCESILILRGSANDNIDKNCFDAHYLRGVIHEYNGFKELAIASFTMAIDLEPNSISALYYRGALYYELGKTPEAIADIDRARAIQECHHEKLVDRDETSFYAEGLALYYTGEFDSAISILRLGFLVATRFGNSSFKAQISLRLQPKFR